MIDGVLLFGEHALYFAIIQARASSSGQARFIDRLKGIREQIDDLIFDVETVQP